MGDKKWSLWQRLLARKMFGDRNPSAALLPMLIWNTV